MIIQGNFVSQNFWTLRAAVTSGHKVLGVNVALDIVWYFGLISTLKALIPSTATKRCHHSLNLSCKKQCNVRDRYVIILYSNSKLIFIKACELLPNDCSGHVCSWEALGSVGNNIQLIQCVWHRYDVWHWLRSWNDIHIPGIDTQRHLQD